MHGLVSLLDPHHYALVEEIWRELKATCGLTGIRVTPFPHFSWQIAQDYDWALLPQIVRAIARQEKPLTIRVTGLGLFTSSRPVVYLPVVRTAALSALHARIWERLSPISRKSSPYYAPDYWVPHISLAYDDVTPGNLHCILDRLATRNFDWQIVIDNLTFIYEPDGETGEKRFEFKLGQG